MPTLTDAEVYQLASDGIPRYEYSYGEYDYHYGGLEVLSYEIEGEKAKVLFQDFSATITVEDLFDFLDTKISVLGFELQLQWKSESESWAVIDYLVDVKLPGPYTIGYHDLSDKADFRFHIIQCLANDIDEYIYENGITMSELADKIKSDFKTEFLSAYC